MRSYKTEGIVIKRRSLAEADRIITIYSKSNGKITIMAKGVRRISSRRSPHIELLNYASFSIHRGTSMFSLSEVESLHNFSSLKKDLKKVGIAYHICELIDSLCAENEHNEQIFHLLNKTLLRIEKEENARDALSEFEINLLKILGFFKEDETSNFKDRHKFIEKILERKLKAKEVASSF
jgi:DNA repair protein RecO (recombination protein O)